MNGRPPVSAAELTRRPTGRRGSPCRPDSNRDSNASDAMSVARQEIAEPFAMCGTRRRGWSMRTTCTVSNTANGNYWVDVVFEPES
jgi:hypothetical protein